jgi:hypothetical protein
MSEENNRLPAVIKRSRTAYLTVARGYLTVGGPPTLGRRVNRTSEYASTSGTVQL